MAEFGGKMPPPCRFRGELWFEEGSVVLMKGDLLELKSAPAPRLVKSSLDLKESGSSKGFGNSFIKR